MRSTRERMWAGVAGGMAEYFDLDPSLVRLLWIAATVVSGGLAVPVYILAWIILPRDDRPPVGGGPYQWRDWSQEFHAETQRLAEEARRVAGEVGQTWHGTSGGPTSHDWPGAAAAPTSYDPSRGAGAGPTNYDPATDKGAPTPTVGPRPAPEEWWNSERYVEPHRHHGRHPRSAGVILVGLGVLLLAANAGIFSWIEWRTMWPLVFIGLGLLLLAKQADWRR
jgi:phage shock protein PspC (stress-responsive transcriptional regulator)